MASLAEEYGVEISDIRYENDAQHFSSVMCSPKEEGSYPAVVYIHGLFGLQEMDVRVLRPAGRGRICGAGTRLAGAGTGSGRRKDCAGN